MCASLTVRRYLHTRVPAHTPLFYVADIAPVVRAIELKQREKEAHLPKETKVRVELYAWYRTIDD